MQILSEIGPLEDPRREAILVRPVAAARLLHPNALRPQEDRDIRPAAIANVIGTAAPAKPRFCLDDRAPRAALDDARRDQIGAAHELGDDNGRRPLVDLARRADLLDLA